jgi:hypothetical protein
MKKLLTLAVVSALPIAAHAAENTSPITVTLGGSLDTQVGYIDQSKPFKYETTNDTTSPKFNDKAIVNDTKIWLSADGEHEGLKFGGKIKLNVDVSRTKSGSADVADLTMVYVEGALGRLEGGAYDGATNAMKVSAASLAKATGGIDGAAKYWIRPQTSDEFDNEDAFVTDPYLPIGCAHSSKVNKITYYTPSFDGLRLGVSYSPDTEAKGTLSVARNLVKSNKPGYRNVVETALGYDKELNDIKVSAGLLYQYGKSKDYTVATVSHSRRDLHAWEAGALVKVANISLAGSYGDWGKSGATRAETTGYKYDSSFWNVGAAYEVDKFGASVTYYESNRGSSVLYDKDTDTFYENLSAKHNKLQMLAVGAEYKLAPGVMPYAEVAHFKHNKADIDLNNKGQVYLGGVKINF